MKPFLVIIDGPPGSGKTTVSQALQQAMKKTALIELDHIKWLVADRAFSRSKKGPVLAARVGAAMAKEFLENGVNVIVEKAFVRDEYIDAFIRAAQPPGRTFVYLLDVPYETSLQRVKGRPLRFGPPRRLSAAKIKRLHAHFRLHRHVRPTRIFETETMKPREILKNILQDIRGSKGEN